MVSFVIFQFSFSQVIGKLTSKKFTSIEEDN